MRTPELVLQKRHASLSTAPSGDTVPCKVTRAVTTWDYTPGGSLASVSLDSFGSTSGMSTASRCVVSWSNLLGGKSGLRVWVLGFRVQGLGFMFEGVGLRVEGLGSRVYGRGLGFGVPGVFSGRFRVNSSRFGVEGLGLRLRVEG